MAMRCRPSLSLSLVLCLACALGNIGKANAADLPPQIRALLVERCLGCHSTEKRQGELDLQQFRTLDQVRRQPLVWQRVLEQLANGEMPPKDAPQLSKDQQRALVEWLRTTLDEIALANAGDPGTVALRRLSNAEYTYTIRDLTGVAALAPAQEFPEDGAAGEGFTNASAALVMSPSLVTKYLDAAKQVADHAVLTSRGVRFSASTSSRDWTNETLARIREFYARFSSDGNATAVNLQGVRFDTNVGGRLPVERYLAALQGQISADGVSGKYLAMLKKALEATEPSLLLDPLREKYRRGALTVADIEPWQRSLWRFASVGHIGKRNGPKAWQEPVTPLVAQQELRLKLFPPDDQGDMTLYMVTGDAGDGSDGDLAIWQNPRLIAPGRSDLPLRDVRAVVQQWEQQRARVIESVTNCLAAADEADQSMGRTEVAGLAEKHGVAPALLAAWLDCLGIGAGGEAELAPLLVNRVERTPDYRFIQGWAGEQALSVLANSSDATVRIPGIMHGHSIATHPSPKLASVIAWRSPIASKTRIAGSVTHAHPECGNGVTWSLELLRGRLREVLASGVTKGGSLISIGPLEGVRVQQGDAIALVVGPRDGNHSCDLTAVNLSLHDGQREWDLAKDVSPDILAGNPHPDRHGNQAVWHFCSRPAAVGLTATLPTGSLLAKWRKASDTVERRRLAAEVKRLLEGGLAASGHDSPDWLLYKQLLSFDGPLLGGLPRTGAGVEDESPASHYGVDPARFGAHFEGSNAGAKDLCVEAPSVIEVKLPAALASGAEFVATGKLQSAMAGSVQMQMLTTRPPLGPGIVAVDARSAISDGHWFENGLPMEHRVPVIVNDGSPARKWFEHEFDEFRALFPVALCYTTIVPVDEVVTLTLFYREDEALKRLMLDEQQTAEIDALWDDLRFISEAPLKQVDAFEQLYQFATQDADPALFEPLREPIRREAETFRQQQIEAEPRHIEAVLRFAEQAWRRPLRDGEPAEMRTLYQTLRRQELSHAAAVRLLIARVLVAPAFLYRGETSAPGAQAAAVTHWELATRLSYFLWSSMPDGELRTLAAAGRLRDADVLAAQTRRMLQDERIRRLATEFGCQWLGVRDVDTLDEKSDRHFPTFAALRGAMREEAVRLFVDLFQADRSVLSLLDADYTFVNGALARHYDLEADGEDWRRVDGVRDKGRGGILGLAAILSRQSGASRTSPILRGTWLSEVVLGEKLPDPPQGVPVLPDETPAGLTERQLTERHSADAQCAGCHRRIDPYGFALEGFDAIGRLRTLGASGLKIDTRAELPDGSGVEGIEGLRDYLVTVRRDDFLRQFCRKLLGYALGRSVQLSDQPLLNDMLGELKANDYRVGTAIEAVVGSPQFRRVRGRDEGLE